MSGFISGSTIPLSALPLERPSAGTLVVAADGNGALFPASMLYLTPSAFGQAYANWLASTRQTASPSTGATVSVTLGMSNLWIMGGSTLATLTIQAPPGPADGQVVFISTAPAITALTVKDSAGNTSDILSSPTSLAAGGGFKMEWSTGANQWWCSVGS